MEGDGGVRDFNYRALDNLSAALAMRKPEDRLHVMAQNPANNHHWSSSMGVVTAADLRTVVNIARTALMAIEKEQEYRL
jgi:hypothetical protein